MDIKKISRCSIHFLVAFLPWSVAFSVLSTERLNIDIFRFSKEIIIACIACLYVYEVIKRKIKIQIDIFDTTVLCFIFTLITVSIWKDVPIKGIMY